MAKINKVRAVYHYSKEDEDFSMDCEGAEIFLNGKELQLPFEEDYPRRYCEVFIAGMKLMDPSLEVTIEEVNDDYW